MFLTTNYRLRGRKNIQFFRTETIICFISEYYTLLCNIETSKQTKIEMIKCLLTTYFSLFPLFIEHRTFKIFNIRTHPCCSNIPIFLGNHIFFEELPTNA